MTVTTTTSTDGSIIAYNGTIQEVINALEAAGINDFRNVQLALWNNNTNIVVLTMSR